jgi:hypothetical protein
LKNALECSKEQKKNEDVPNETLEKNECKSCVDIFVNMRIYLLYAKGEFKKVGIHITYLVLS